jgi:hypothetical protein
MFDLAAKRPEVAKAITSRLTSNGKLAGAAE